MKTTLFLLLTAAVVSAACQFVNSPLYYTQEFKRLGVNEPFTLDYAVANYEAKPQLEYFNLITKNPLNTKYPDNNDLEVLNSSVIYETKDTIVKQFTLNAKYPSQYQVYAKAKCVGESEITSPTNEYVIGIRVCMVEPPEPTCGENGVTYFNPCEANANKVKIRHPGQCSSTSVTITPPQATPQPITIIVTANPDTRLIIVPTPQAITIVVTATPGFTNPVNPPITPIIVPISPQPITAITTPLTSQREIYGTPIFEPLKPVSSGGGGAGGGLVVIEKPCTEEYAPVCGYNNVTYWNECLAVKAGTEKMKTGQCDAKVANASEAIITIQSTAEKAPQAIAAPAMQAIIMPNSAVASLPVQILQTINELGVGNAIAVTGTEARITNSSQTNPANARDQEVTQTAIMPEKPPIQTNAPVASSEKPIALEQTPTTQPTATPQPETQENNGIVETIIIFFKGLFG